VAPVARERGGCHEVLGHVGQRRRAASPHRELTRRTQSQRCGQRPGPGEPRHCGTRITRGGGTRAVPAPDSRPPSGDASPAKERLRGGIEHGEHDAPAVKRTAANVGLGAGGSFAPRTPPGLVFGRAACDGGLVAQPGGRWRRPRGRRIWELQMTASRPATTPGWWRAAHPESRGFVGGGSLAGLGALGAGRLGLALGEPGTRRGGARGLQSSAEARVPGRQAWPSRPSAACSALRFAST